MTKFTSKTYPVRVKHAEYKPTLYSKTSHKTIAPELYNKIDKFKYSGIYQVKSITCNTILYVGCSKNIHQRIHCHISAILYNRKNEVPGLKEHCRKHGITDLDFDVLEETTDLAQREFYYINKLRPQFNILTANKVVGATIEFINTIKIIH